LKTDCQESTRNWI